MLPPVMYGVLLCVCTADTKSHKRYANKKYVQTYLGMAVVSGQEQFTTEEIYIQGYKLTGFTYTLFRLIAPPERAGKTNMVNKLARLSVNNCGFVTLLINIFILFVDI